MADTKILYCMDNAYKTYRNIFRTKTNHFVFCALLGICSFIVKSINWDFSEQTVKFIPHRSSFYDIAEFFRGLWYNTE